MKSLKFSALTLLVVLASHVWALEKQAFDKDRFDALREAGEVVLLDINAEWCSTCARQQKIIEAYVDGNPDKALHILDINYDRDKEWVRHFRAPRQSTLLLYRGEEQVWFSVAETRPEVIEAALNEAFATPLRDAR